MPACCRGVFSSPASLRVDSVLEKLKKAAICSYGSPFSIMSQEPRRCGCGGGVLQTGQWRTTASKWKDCTGPAVALASEGDVEEMRDPPINVNVCTHVVLCTCCG